VVTAYKEWLEHYAIPEPEQLLRLFDLTETLKHDRLMVAFVAEFSRGKTELIKRTVFKDCAPEEVDILVTTVDNPIRGEEQ
jgi:hypothetical protein